MMNWIKSISFIIVFVSGMLVLNSHQKQTTPKVKVSHNAKQSVLYPDVAHRCLKDQEWTVDNIAKWLGESVEKIEKAKSYKLLSNEDLCKMPSHTLAWLFKKVDAPKRPDKPDEAVRFRTMQQSVDGEVKADGLLKAIEKRKEILSSSISSEETAGAGIQKHSWKSIGPGHIGGRVRSIWIHPSDTNLIFAGSVGGGLWRSRDAGVSWEAVDDFMGNLAISSIAADPRTTSEVNSTVMYAATGEGFFNIDGLRGYGVFKSTDGGETWEHLSSTNPSDDSDWYYVNRVAVSSKGVIIAVARDNGIFVSKDGGDSWEKTYRYVGGTNNWRYQVCWDPNDSNNSIVASDSGYVYYTRDEGENWDKTQIVSTDGFSGRVEVSYAASEANVVYASVQNNQGEIYKSTDGGETWTYLSNPQHLGNQGWYANAIWVDPTDANHLVIAGLDVYRSTDGGVNWDKISTWYYAPSSPHADHHTIVSEPGNPSRVYVANDGGIYKTDDISTANDDYSNNGWVNLNNNFGVTQFYDSAGIVGSAIIGGTQDNGDLLHNDDDTWTVLNGGDGGFSGVVPSTTAGEFYYFGEYVYLRMHRSNNGEHAVDIFDDLDDAVNNNANFIAPFSVDPNNADVILAGGDSLWRSTNIRAEDPNDITWNTIKDSIGSNISQVAIANGDSNLVVVGYNNGEIYKSTDATSASPTWTKIHDDNGKMVLALHIDKDDHNTIYAGWGGFASENLQVTKDGGSTWSVISDGLPDAPMRSVVRNPNQPDYLYVGTEVGIFTSEDGGEHWQTSNDGPANVSVDRLYWYDNTTLVAATHGRGVFKISYAQPRVIAKNDFNKDGVADIFFRDPSTSKNLIYFQNPDGTRDSYVYIDKVTSDWNASAIADFDRDGIADILYRNYSDGRNVIFFQNSDGSRKGYKYFDKINPDWIVAGTGDFDEDGVADIVFRNSTNGKNIIFFMNSDGSKKAHSYFRKINTSWDIVGIGDINDDGVDDLFLREQESGKNLIYFMNSDGKVSSTKYFDKISSDWYCEGVADFNHDGVSDIFFRNRGNGDNLIFFLNSDGSKASHIYTQDASPRWQVANIADFNGDLIPDVLYRDQESGENLIFFLNSDGSRASYNYTTSISSSWQVVR
jgi:photosystem II stability/assembly factor-like uncharacterized protein